MRVNLVRLAIVLVLIAIGLTLFGGPFVIGAGGWPMIEMWSTQFWAFVAAVASFPLFEIARKTSTDVEAIEFVKGVLKMYALMAGVVFAVISFCFLMSPGGFGFSILFLFLAFLCCLPNIKIV